MSPFGGPAEIVHLHLLLNHVPTIGTVVGLGVFLLGLRRKNPSLRAVALEILFIVALVTLPVYLTGGGAISAVQPMNGVWTAALTAHRDAAVVAFMLMQLTGGVAWLALWMHRRRLRAAVTVSYLALAFAVLTLALMGNAANIGGEIRHSEIGTAPAAAAFARIDRIALGQLVISHLWMWPALEALHFAGMSLSFGVLLIVNIHMLGSMRGTPYLAVHRLLLWGMLGIGMNVVTGMLFFSGNIEQYWRTPRSIGRLCCSWSPD